MAQQAWFTYQGLRVAHLRRDQGARPDGSGGVSPHDEQLAELIASNAASEHRVALAEAEELLKALSDRFGLIGELPRSDKVTLGGRKRSAAEVKAMANEALNHLAALLGKSVVADAPLPAGHSDLENEGSPGAGRPDP
jgi:hypothetical protein